VDVKIIVFTGAGISAESGLSTFRDQGGLWDKYPIEEVATPEAFTLNPEKVLEFYNLRRKLVANAEPNKAHEFIAKLEEVFEVTVITQNIDDLHERAGSKNIIHLHGEINLAMSSSDERLLFDVKGKDIQLGDLCPKGSQLRPHVVWFGEEVPMMDDACKVVANADVFIVVGTSLNVYPAANLVHYIPMRCRGYLIDPNPVSSLPANFTAIAEKASVAVPKLVAELLNKV
jgi:NAD-dependent deacetylase